MSKTDRLDRLEAAISNGLGINLAEFDDKHIVAEREAVIAEAKVQAEAVLAEAFDQISKPLSTEERLARIERALASGASL